jgi:hypothetical protein
MTETPTRDDDEGEDEGEENQRLAVKSRESQPAPDWLTAQAKAIGTARPAKPKSAYVRRFR